MNFLRGIAIAVISALGFGAPMPKNIPPQPVGIVLQEIPKETAIQLSAKPEEPKPPELKIDEGTKENIYTSCIRTARALGLSIPLWDARDLVGYVTPDGNVVGGGILLRYINDEGEPIYHVAVIQSFEKTGWFVYEGNFKKGLFTQRTIIYNDPALVGFLPDDLKHYIKTLK